jgi:ferritin
MLSKKIEQALNEQVKIEGQSSQVYLAMASWAETQPGIDNVTAFFYRHSEEERMHMLKLIHFINERGGTAIIPSFEQPTSSYPSIKQAFKDLLNHEIMVSESINNLVDIALTHKDYSTYNFLQWYVAEQIEEEALARSMNDKLEMIGDEKSGLYLFDRDILGVTVEGGETGGGA